MNVAFFHGIALDDGGGVTIARAVEECLDADVVFGIADPAVVEPGDTVLYGGRFARRAGRNPTLRPIYSCLRNRSIPQLESYDVVVESGSTTAWYTPPPDQTVIRYVHSVPAVAAGARSSIGGVLDLVTRALREPTHRYPARWLANSELTADRVEQYLGVQADVLHPPVDVGGFEASEAAEHHLLLSRLTENKGVASVLDAFRDTDERLVVCGKGELESRLRAEAPGNVDVRGWVSEDEKRDLLARSKSVLMPSGRESFGIVAIEAFAAGVPVVARAGGYMDYLVEDGYNGVRYDVEADDASTDGDAGDATAGELRSALERVEAVEASAEDLQADAAAFGYDRFAERLGDVVDAATGADRANGAVVP